MTANELTPQALDKAEARQLTDQICTALEVAWELVAEAYAGRAWVALGYDSWDEYVEREFGTSRLRLPKQDRAEVVAALSEHGLSLRAIASATGESRSTIGRALSLVPNGTREVLGTDGKTYRVSREWTPSALFSSASSDWLTPALVLDRVVKVLSRIDLDPCSESKTHPNVPARKHYTIEDDGLRHPWPGRVFCNPPYGAEVGRFVDKLVFEFRAGRTKAAIALLPARVDTAWFDQLADFPWCFFSGRLRFSQSETSAPFPSGAVYLGTRNAAFAKVFGEGPNRLGNVFVRVDRNSRRFSAT